MTATRSPALSEMNFRGLSINSSETAITVTADDSGVVFLNDNSSATTYTLPSVSLGAGKFFVFVNCDTAAATVITSTTALIKGVNASAKTTLTSAAIGNFAIVFGDGTNWFLVGVGGAWTITT